MMRRRRLAIGVAAATAGAAGLILLAHPPAAAVDVWGNVGPASQLAPGALADAYPLGNYALDHHFSAVDAGVFSGVDVSGIAPTVAWLLANLLWQLTALLANAVITLFTFAFSLDLVNGSATTGGAGALGPVSDAVRSIYRDVFGQAWLTVAVLLTGMWSMWQALVRRRYTETAGALALSLLYIVIALAFVTQPERTIGQASQWTNEISTAFLSLTADGSIGEAQRSKQDASDHLFELLVYRPWVVLQFGGLEHCVRNAGSDDPTDVPVRPLAADADRDAQLARQLARNPQIEADGKVCVNNRLKYAPHFLRFEPGSDQRNAQYEALKDGDSGKLPDEDPGKDDGTYRLGPVDKPAAEAMGKSAQYQRLGLAVVIFAGELGIYLLLGALAVSVIVAQVLVLLLLAFAPVALVIGTFPGRGHQFFLDWLTRLASFLLKKAVYSLILAVLLAVSAALQSATSNLGWLMAFGLQAVFFWAVFLNRKQLAGQLGATVTGASGQRDEARLLAGIGAAYAMGRVLRRSFGGIAKAAGGGPTAGARRSPRPPRPEPPAPPAPTPHNDPSPSRGPSASGAATATPDDAETPSNGAEPQAETRAPSSGAQRSTGARHAGQVADAVDRHTPPSGASSAAPDQPARPAAAASDDTQADRFDTPEYPASRGARPEAADPPADATPTQPTRRTRPPATNAHDRLAGSDQPPPLSEQPAASAAEPAAKHPLTASVHADAERLRRERPQGGRDVKPGGGHGHPSPPAPELRRSQRRREGGDPR
jgi:hypothetical protein